jgi:tRNA-intron endonuclease, archaea type
MAIQAHLIGQKISSNSKDAHHLFMASGFGERKNDTIHYAPYEVLYLVQKGKMTLQDAQGNSLTKQNLERKLQRLDKNFRLHYAVFSDLRNKGYIVKSGLKFGAAFRVYDKGKKASEEHARWLVIPTTDKKSLAWQDFSSKNRVAHSTKKKLLIAVVDDEDSVTYFETAWLRP